VNKALVIGINLASSQNPSFFNPF